MKAKNIILGLVACCFFTGVSAQTTPKSKAQSEIISMLQSKGIVPTVDSDDNSISFRKDDVLFWITIDGNDSTRHYTIHRRGFKLGGPKGYNKLQALKSCNEVSKKHGILAFCKTNSVEFALPVYSGRITDFKGCFDNSLAVFDNVSNTFKQTYRQFEKLDQQVPETKVDSIESGKSILVMTDSVACEQQADMKILSMMTKSVDASGNIISEMSETLKSETARYIQFTAMVSCSTPGDHRVGVRVYNDKGELYLPSEGALFTSLTPLTLKKGEDMLNFDLTKFGSESGGFWKKGNYHVDVFDNGLKVYETSFEVN